MSLLFSIDCFASNVLFFMVQVLCLCAKFFLKMPLTKHSFDFHNSDDYIVSEK